MPVFTTTPILHQNKPARESIICDKVGDWLMKRALIMLKFLLKSGQKSVDELTELTSWRVNKWQVDKLTRGRMDELTSGRVNGWTS